MAGAALGPSHARRARATRCASPRGLAGSTSRRRRAL